MVDDAPLLQCTHRQAFVPRSSAPLPAMSEMKQSSRIEYSNDRNLFILFGHRRNSATPILL
jgi:hypothetical protein